MHPHDFRKTLLGYVDAYVKHDADHERTEGKAERKRIADRRRRAADGIARTCETVAATLAEDGEDGEAKASGGYRAAIVRARKTLPVKAHRLLDGLPCDDVRAWDPDATYRCPKCGLVGPATDDFGARLETMAFDVATLPSLRVWWLDVNGAALAPRQRKRVAAFKPYPHPTVKGLTYALAPFRQSNCNACRNEAAKRSAERRNASQCG